MLRIGFLMSPGYSVMSFSALAVFEAANIMAAKPVYDLRLLSEAGGPIRTSVGMMVDTEAFNRVQLDTLIVGGGNDVQTPAPGLVEYIRQSLGQFRRVAAICIGAFLLAEAGVLDGRRATTHWRQSRELQARFPKIRADEDRIFINDGPVWTSAGMTAGIDLALALVDSDLGTDIARAVAKEIVVYHRRAGGQMQHSALLELEPKSDRIQSSLAYAKRNLHRTLSVEQLAKAANLSPRQFSRAFRKETGQSPAKAIENLRVEAARLMMEQGQHPMHMVARQTGFADRDRMRRAFMRTLGQPPQTVRRNAHIEAKA
jgi:transcriptional regulator GlxA family with amidase domain